MFYSGWGGGGLNYGYIMSRRAGVLSAFGQSTRGRGVGVGGAVRVWPIQPVEGGS